MKELLNKLIAEAPEENEGAAQLQLQIGGQVYAGAVKQSDDYEGLYEMITLGQQQAGAIVVSVFFKADDVQIAFVPKGEPSKVIQGHASGLVIPGLS